MYRWLFISFLIIIILIFLFLLFLYTNKMCEIILNYLYYWMTLGILLTRGFIFIVIFQEKLRISGNL